MKNLHQLFDWQYIGQIIGGDFAKCCGLLRIYKLYKELCSHIGGADSRLTKATEAKSADFSAIAHVLQLMICAKKKWEGGGNCTFLQFSRTGF